jgi:hypothetical protein
MASAGRSISLVARPRIQWPRRRRHREKRTCYEHCLREKCAGFGDGDRSAGDPFVAGCEQGGFGVEAGVGAAEEGDVRGGEGSP